MELCEYIIGSWDGRTLLQLSVRARPHNTIAYHAVITQSEKL